MGAENVYYFRMALNEITERSILQDLLKSMILFLIQKTPES